MIKNMKKYSQIIQNFENTQVKNNIPRIEIGDTIKIKKVIQEGNKERIQNSEGVVISKRNSNLNESITVRKIIQNVGVERIYALHSPHIISIEIIRKSKVRRAKLYYLRKRSGKATRLKQKLQ
uniref:Large ribosomal subunit protein bL19c n=1 Tax=Osmundaria fimbriata TaxID=228265 RepID=A0A1Z1M4H9_OSMFI|nr:ribosomal protein L19 [Osmundaria fimbriata]ARW60916.1 ribosomal protein L19 [Osmundaria fimbriata]